MLRQIILDTETTGLSTEEGHRIIEIGCVEMINRFFTESHFHHYIDPERAIDAGAQQVHGITNEFLTGKPKFHEIAEAFVDYIQGAELIIHNADFDLGFLNYELGKLGHHQKIEQSCKVIDTLKMARKKHPGQKNNLDALCKRYFVDASKRKFHGALLDAQILGEVYLAMTAGQIDFLAAADVSRSNNLSQQIIQASSRRPVSLPVLQANFDELKTHIAFIEKLKKKAGKEIEIW